MKRTLVVMFTLFNTYAFADDLSLDEKLSLTLGEISIPIQVVNEGEFLVKEYPVIQNGEFSLEKMKTFDLGSDANTICNNVEKRLRLLSSPWLSQRSKDAYRRSIRNLNQFRIKVSLGRELLWQNMNKLYLETFQEVGFVTNPWTISEIQFTERWTDDSLSSVIGDPSLVSKISLESINLLLFTGETYVEFTESDLFCDLISDRLKLSSGLVSHYLNSEGVAVEDLHDIDFEGITMDGTEMQ